MNTVNEILDSIIHIVLLIAPILVQMKPASLSLCILIFSSNL